MTITGEMMMAAASATGHTIHPEDLRKALEAALSASPAGVKPLEWRKLYEDSQAWPMTWHGKGLFDKIYPIEQYYSSGQFYTLGKGFDTLEAAKSAAFADYSARIMSAIEPAGVGAETASDDASLLSKLKVMRGIYAMQNEQYTSRALHNIITEFEASRAALTKEATHG
jgi:hypothetical protein